MENTKREVWIDWMRVMACFMVMVVHSTEPFYLGGDGSLILTKADMFWASFFDSFVRACVPLFIVASSYLQFPLKYPTKEFFKRRAVRILFPFIFWTVVYALMWGEPVQNFKDLLVNFNYSAGHLWFVYLIIGIYLIMPLLSPWAEKASRGEVLFFTIICLGTSVAPVIRYLMTEGATPVIFGTGGLPMTAKYPLWGEASWNAYGTLYYISGFLGYLLLGLYLRKFGKWSAGKSAAVAIPCWIAGFALCFFAFVQLVMKSSGGVFPVGGDITLGVSWETFWNNDTLGVVLMTLGWLLLLRHIKCSGKFYEKIIVPVSKAGYGMYLCHMIALAYFSGLWRGLFGIGDAGTLGVWTSPVEILLTAVCSFVSVSIFCVLGQKIPKVGKYIFG